MTMDECSLINLQIFLVCVFFFITLANTGTDDIYAFLCKHFENESLVIIVFTENMIRNVDCIYIYNIHVIIVITSMDPCSLYLSQHYFKLFECDESIRKFMATVWGLETNNQLSMLLASCACFAEWFFCLWEDHVVSYKCWYNSYLL